MDGFKYAQGEMVYYMGNGVAYTGRVRYIQKGTKLPYWVTIENGEDVWAKEEELRPYRGK